MLRKVRNEISPLIAFAFLLMCLNPSSVTAQNARLPKPSEVVKPRAYVSLESVPRGAEFEVAVAGEIIPGFHVNANKVLDEYLIPTTLEAQLPPGFRLVDTKYPAGVPKKFPFSEKPLQVYEGKFLVRLKLKAPAGAPLGALKLPMTLRYQACNDEACLPPVKLPVDAELTISPAGTKSRPANPDIFSKNM